jgi:hypothetical protein
LQNLFALLMKCPQNLLEGLLRYVTKNLHDFKSD